MKLQRSTSCAMGLAVALTLTASSGAGAQDTSQVRIPVRKGVSTTRTEPGTVGTVGTSGTARTEQGVTRRESGGDVANLMILRIDSLELVASNYQTRIDALEAANTASATRSAALEARISALSDSLATARTELAAVREELVATNARLTETDNRLQGLQTRFNRFRSHSLFGNSGFYIGLGTGASFTSGTLRQVGYESAPLVNLPIGWQKRGSRLGLRTEWSMNRLEGVQTDHYLNPDPTVASGVALATLNFPVNKGQTTTFYVMGGGGFYTFRDFGIASGLGDKFEAGLDGDNNGETETKWGLQAGIGMEIHVLGATSLFVQSSLTNVTANRGSLGVEGRNLRWMPIVVGFQLR